VPNDVVVFLFAGGCYAWRRRTRVVDRRRLLGRPLIEPISATEEAAGLLAAKGIPHSLHVWGHGSHHDWPEWTKMAAAYVP